MMTPTDVHSTPDLLAYIRANGARIYIRHETGGGFQVRSVADLPDMEWGLYVWTAILQYARNGQLPITHTATPVLPQPQ